MSLAPAANPAAAAEKTDFVIEEWSAAQLRHAVPEFCTLLAACVELGAGVGFVLPHDYPAMEAFWSGLEGSLAVGGRILFAARWQGRLAGTVQLVPSGMPNGVQRAEISKLLVHPAARRRGIAEALMKAAEARALREGRTTLVLDTGGAVAERLYRRLGWIYSGSIPAYALSFEGVPETTHIFYKHLSGLTLPPGLVVERSAPSFPAAAPLLDALSDELGRRFGSDGRAGFAGWQEGDARSAFLLARLGDAPAGCGALLPLEAAGVPSGEVGEIKRMYAATPRAGIGSAVLAALEANARALGYRQLWLETRHANAEAMAFYHRHGFSLRENYGRYTGRAESACLERKV
ncbi:GNAT family N-acetyltransferase [Radicibacter daui]|uniref:GNAT family N-acetyltransferase n=1 Tax=Radicibacter daui TaxID=3064829 RepID=UPI004046EA09